jgi:hypothetical protein
MHWEILVIPLIAFGVWILGTIFRGAEEAAKDRARRFPGEGGPQRRRGATDLDRFLEEARRRREGAEQAKAGPAVDPLDRPLSQQAEAPPRPTPILRPQPQQRREPAKRVPQSRPKETTPPARPSPRVMLEMAPPETRAAPPPQPPPPPPSQEVPQVATTPPTVPRRQQVSAAVAQVARLLRSPQTAGAAYVLREILDEPMCKRRRR